MVLSRIKTAYIFPIILIGCTLVATIAVLRTPKIGSGGEPRSVGPRSVGRRSVNLMDESVLHEAILTIAKIKGPSPEQTNKLHNEELNQLFQQYIEASGGEVTGPSIRRFQTRAATADRTACTTR